MVRLSGAAMASFLCFAALGTPCSAQRKATRLARGHEKKYQPGRNLKDDGKGSGKGDAPEECSTDCKNTIPDFVKNILNLGFDPETELFSGFGYCTGDDFDENFDKLCCSASALRSTIGGTWADFLFTDAVDFPDCDEADPFIASTAKKPNWLEATQEIVEPLRRKLSPAGEGTGTASSSGAKEANADVADLFVQDARLVEAMEEALAQPSTRRRLGISDKVLENASRKLQAGEDEDDGFVCLLATVIAWIVEFNIDGEIGGIGPLPEGLIPGGIAGGVGDAIRNIGCDISGLLTSKCEEWAPVVNIDDFDFSLDQSGFEFAASYGLLIEGYVSSEISFLICKLVKELIALIALFIFSPWLLPACHCHYRTEIGCNVDSCYETCPITGELMPKKDLVDDLAVARERYFPGPDVGEFTQLLRACNAVPGDRSYFLARLPEGEIGPPLAPLLLGGFGRFGFSPDGPDIPPFVEDLNDAEIELMTEVGQCFNLADSGLADEDYSYEDALAYFQFLMGGAMAIPPPIRQPILDCLMDVRSGNVAAIRSSLNDIVDDFPDEVSFIAVSFFFANGGEPDDIDASFTGILFEILGDDLLEALFELELGGGLFPVRRGGKPIDQCLGYCFMHGTLCAPVEEENPAPSPTI